MIMFKQLYRIHIFYIKLMERKLQRNFIIKPKKQNNNNRTIITAKGKKIKAQHLPDDNIIVMKAVNAT